MAFDLTAYINTQLNLNSAQKLKADIEKNINSIQGRININANVSQLAQLKLQLNQLKQEIKDVNAMSDKLDKSVGKLQPAFSNLNASLNKTNSMAKNSAYVFADATSALDAFGEQTALAARRFVAFSVAFSAINGFASMLGDAVRESITFNREIIRISQVSEDSFAKVKDLSREITRLATSLGVSSLELVKSGVLLRQAGLSTQDTTIAMEALAKAALAPNFDDLASTTNGLIAVMQQFNIKAKDFESVLGSMNSVAGAFAVEASDLIEVVKKTGGVFASIKGDSKSGRDALNELMALFTSVRATTRESAEQISTGLRTIFGRLQRQETVEALKTLGVQLRYTKKDIEESGLNESLEGQFVGGYEAIRRISQALNQIPSTDPKFAAIVEQIGGLRQLSRVTPLVQQFSESQRALAIAQSGQASLAINASQAQDALAIKINKVREEWISLGRTITEDNGFSRMTDIVSSFSSVLTGLLGNLTPLLPVLGAVGASSAIAFAIKGYNAFTQRSQYPGFKATDPAFMEMLNQKSGPGGYFYKPETAKMNLLGGKASNDLIVKRPEKYREMVYDSLYASASNALPGYSHSQIKQVVEDEITNQINQANKASRLSSRSSSYQKSATQNLLKATEIEEAASFFKDFKDGRITTNNTPGATQRYGQSKQILSQLGLLDKDGNIIMQNLDKAISVMSIFPSANEAFTKLNGGFNRDAFNTLKGLGYVSDLQQNNNANPQLMRVLKNFASTGSTPQEALNEYNKYLSFKADTRRVTTPKQEEEAEAKGQEALAKLQSGGYVSKTGKINIDLIKKHSLLVDQNSGIFQSQVAKDLEFFEKALEGKIPATKKNMEIFNKIEENFTKLGLISRTFVTDTNGFNADADYYKRLMSSDLLKNVNFYQNFKEGKIKDGPDNTGRFADVTKQLSDLGLLDPQMDIDQKKLYEMTNQLKVKSQIEANMAAKIQTEANAIKERQSLAMLVDYSGNQTVTSPAAQGRIEEQGKNIENKVGLNTIKGLIQSRTEEQIVTNKIVSEKLKLFTQLKQEEAVKQEYIRAVSRQLRALGMVEDREQSLIVAMEMYERGLINNSIDLSLSNGKIVTDSSIGSASKMDLAKQTAKDFLQDNSAKLQLGIPILAGLVSSRLGTATDAIGPNGVGSGTAYSISNAVTGGAGLAVGASLATGNPYAIAGAAVVGFTTSLIDAKKEIAEAKLGVEIQKVADRFRQIAEGLVETSDSVEDIKNARKEIVNNSISSVAYGSPLTYLFNSESTSAQVNQKIRESLSKSSSQSYGTFLKELEKSIKESPIKEGESKKSFAERITTQLLNRDGGFFNSQLNDMAFIEKVSRSKIDDRIGKQVMDMVAQKDFNRSGGDSIRIVNTFDLLAEAVSGATNEVRKFGSSAEDIANAINGNFNFVKTSVVSDRLKSSSVFDLSTMAMATSSLGGLMGGAGSRFQSQGEAIALTRQALPLILSSVRSMGNLGQAGNIQGVVISQVEEALKRAGVSNRRIGEIGAAISTGFSQKDLDKLFEEMGSDVSKIAEKLLEPIAKPFTESLVSIRKELEISTNSYIQQLNSLEASTKKINDIMDSSAGLQRRADLTGAEIASRYSGILPADAMPMVNLLRQSVIRDAGTDNARVIADKISENFKKLVGAQAAVDNALANRFAPGGEKVYQDTINNFVKLQAETAQLTNALQKLTDASKQLTEIQEKINLLKQEENAAFGMARQKLTSREAERKLERGKEIFEEVKAGRNINDLGRREAGLFFNFVDTAGPRAKAVADAAMRKGGLGLNPKDEKELQELEKKKQKIEQESSDAAKAYAEAIRIQTEFMRNQLMASQERMVAALHKNSETIELQQKLTEQGITASQMKEMKGAVDASSKLKALSSKEFGGIDSQILVDNRDRIASFAKFKEAKDLQEMFSIKLPLKIRATKTGDVQEDINLSDIRSAGGSRGKKVVEDISAIYKEALGVSPDASIVRNELVAKLKEKYMLSETDAAKIIPTGTDIKKDPDQYVAQMIQNMISHFSKNKINEQVYSEKVRGMWNIGINPSDVTVDGLKAAVKAIDEIKSYGLNIKDLDDKTAKLSKTFKELEDSIKNSKIYIDNMKAVEQKRNLKEGAAAIMGFGAVEARGFALGGIMNFKPQGRDKIPAMLAPGEAVIPEKLMRSAPIGSLTRMILARNIEGGMPAPAFDRGPFQFGMNTYAAKNKAFNTSSYLTAGPSYVNKPGLSAQRSIEASIIKESAANALSLARESYSIGQMRRQGIKVIGMASGGKVPGFGNGDTVPAMLTPGEVVLDKRTSEKLGNNALGKVQAFANGGQVLGGNVNQQVNFNDSFEKFGSYINIMVGAFNQFEKNVNLLAEALDKSIKVEGEQNINLNVTGLAGLKSEDTESMKEKILDVVNDRLKEIYPHFV